MKESKGTKERVDLETLFAECCPIVLRKIFDVGPKGGIYCIRNKVNNKRYIGSSINVPKRLREHLRLLRKKTHSNPHLQKSWNKYGELNFGISLLEFCAKENLIERENSWILNFQSSKENFGYNIQEPQNLDTLKKNERKKFKGHPNKLSEDIVKAIICELLKGKTRIGVSRQFNLSRSFIDSIANNKVWKQIEREIIPAPKTKHSPKLTQLQINEIREQLAQKKPQAEICALYKIDISHLWRIKSKTSWK